MGFFSQEKCCFCLFHVKVGVYIAVFLCVAMQVLFVINLGFWNVYWIAFCAVLIAIGAMNLILPYFIIRMKYRVVKWIAIGDCVSTFINFGVTGAVAGLIFLSSLSNDLKDQSKSDCISYGIVRNIVLNNIMRSDNATFTTFVENNGVSVYSIYLVVSCAIFSIIFGIGTLNVWLFLFYADNSFNLKVTVDDGEKKPEPNPYERSNAAAAYAAAAAAGYDISLLHNPQMSMGSLPLGQMPLYIPDRASIALSQRSFLMTPTSPANQVQNAYANGRANVPMPMLQAGYTGSLPSNQLPNASPGGMAAAPPSYGNLGTY